MLGAQRKIGFVGLKEKTDKHFRSEVVLFKRIEN
jgi:hypothetical protein